jgi:TonB family protein
MIGHRSASRLLITAALLAGGMQTYAQSTPPPIDPAISNLAARIAEPLRKAHAKKVMVADLKGPEGQVHPVGKYLADRLTEALQKEFPELQVLDRSQQISIPSDEEDSDYQGIARKKQQEWARALGANFVIAGSFAKFSQGIGVSLLAMPSNESSRWLGATNGVVPIADEIIALSSDPIPSPKNGIFRAGIGGTTIPTCIHCPPPDYTDKARAAKFQGVVLLEVVVNTDGRTGRIIVLKGPGLGLEETSIKAVQKWKLKPAVGPDGHPVQVLVPIEVTYRLN